MNAFTINILITILTYSVLPFFLNYIILGRNLKYGIIIFFSIVLFYSFIIGYLISYISGQYTCSNSFSSTCFCKGLKQSFYSTLVYAIIFFVPFFKSGFIGIGGDSIFNNCIAEMVILVLTNISLTIDNYFRSIKDNCKLDFDLSTAAWKRIEKKLNSRKKKDIEEMVEIKP